MRRIYNYNTKKLYESVNVYTLSLEEFDSDGNSTGEKEFDDTYQTIEDALEDTYEIMTNVAANDGIDEDDIEYTQVDGNTIKFTAPGYGEWIFTVGTKDNIVSESMVNEVERHFSTEFYGGDDEELGDVYDDDDELSDYVYKNKHILGPDDIFFIAHGKQLPNTERNIKMEYSGNEYMFVDYELKPALKSEYDGVRTYPTVEEAKNIVDFLYRIFNIKHIIQLKHFSEAYDLISKLIGKFGKPYPEVEEYVQSLIDGEGTDEYVEIVDDEDVRESVTSRFARLRKMFESDDDDDEKDDSETDDEENDTDGDTDDEENDTDKDTDKDEDDDEEMTSVVITVKKGDEDKCKDELVDAGVAEEDIEILDSDDDDKNVDIRIDVNSVMELKDYLEKKGIDLEEEIGGEIVSDEDDEDSEEDSDEDSEEGEDKEGDEEDFNFDDLGDIFGAEEDEEK